MDDVMEFQRGGAFKVEDRRHMFGLPSEHTGLPHVVAWLASQCWAIEPGVLAALREVVARRASGIRLDSAEIAAATGTQAAAARVGRATAGAVAVLPLRGIIAHRAEMVNDISGPGGTSVQRFTEQFRAAMRDDEIKAVLIDVDSPGGSTGGVEELAAEIAASRGAKRIVAQANTTAASAAYWIAASADEIVVTPSGEVGSIGIFAAHEDLSAQRESEGVKTTLISAGRFKVEGNPFEALGDDARAAIQERVDVAMEAFVSAVARGRGVAPAAVRDGFGQGRVVPAERAVALGMADRVATFDETLAGMMERKPEVPRRRAERFF